MRELIASIGMIQIKASVSSNSGRKKRKQYADVFLKMIEIQEKKWAFSEPGPENAKTPGNRCEELKPYYNKLKEMGIVDVLRSFTNEMTRYRNGFDHAWTDKSEAFKSEAFIDIEEKSMVFLNKTKEVLSMLQATGMI